MVGVALGTPRMQSAAPFSNAPDPNATTLENPFKPLSFTYRAAPLQSPMCPNPSHPVPPATYRPATYPPATYPLCRPPPVPAPTPSSVAAFIRHPPRTPPSVATLSPHLHVQQPSRELPQVHAQQPRLPHHHPHNVHRSATRAAAPQPAPLLHTAAQHLLQRQQPPRGRHDLVMW